MPPPRKEPKESVVYPSSKRKTPAFKPLRPSKVPRISTTESESSVKSKKPTPKKSKPAQRVALSDSDEDDEDLVDLSKTKSAAIAGWESEDSDTLEDDPMKTAAKSKAKAAPKPAPARRKSTTREASPMSISSAEHANDPPDVTAGVEPVPSQSDPIPSIPQPLLLRLLHESFADKNTKIDKQAIQVLQKYVEIYVREAIARTEAEKREAAERGECSEIDGKWLEAEDLEKVVAGLILDF